jgi:4-diphosphocytidyl-2-C-methyl-D-erythritol kinase
MVPPLVTERALAKVNLCLHVTGQRADGYHLLDSLVAFVGIGDTLHATPSDASSLTLEGPFGAEVPADFDNLVLRAARAYAPDFPVAFSLEKHLPPASGIGGGSADAAAAVRAVLRLRGDADLPPADSPALLGLGADIPVCLMSHHARMRGIGERLDLLADFPGGAIVLANPRLEVPTPAVFKELVRKDNTGLPETLPKWRDLAALADWLRHQRNDLEAPALQIAPEIGAVLHALRALPDALIARMSGSGATCFALFADLGAAEAAAAALRRNHPGWWVAAGAVYPGNSLA